MASGVWLREFRIGENGSGGLEVAFGVEMRVNGVFFVHELHEKTLIKKGILRDSLDEVED